MRSAYLNYVLAICILALLVLLLFWPLDSPALRFGEYDWNTWAELAPAFERVGRRFDYTPFRRSDNVEDARSDGAIAQDNISIQDFRRAYERALAHHDPLPSIIINRYNEARE